MAFTYLKVKSAKCLFSGGLGLVILVLVLRIRSCLHHCHRVRTVHITYQVFSKTFHDPVQRVEVLVL